MVRNVAIKKMFKNTVFKAASLINKLFIKDNNTILLYSANGGIQHSLIPLKKYLLDYGYYKKYRIICGIESMKYAENDDHVEYVSRLKAMILFLKTKYVFYTTGQIPIKPSESQCVVHLRHGNANFKASGKLTNINNGDEFYFTHMVASSPLFVESMCREYGCKPKNIVIAGDPLVDQLLNGTADRYDFKRYSKVILWLPTFRQSDYLGYDDSEIEELVPLFKETEYPNLNEKLQKYNIKLIVKLHPAQKVPVDGERHFSHLDIYTNSEFIKAGYELYSLMAQSDVLVGDYSSASMQYLLLNRPQAYVIPDVEEYAEKRGFLFDDPEEYMAGYIIKEQKEFYQFLDDIASDNDPYVEKRRKVRDLVYEYQDGNSCKRILDIAGITME